MVEHTTMRLLKLLAVVIVAMVLGSVLFYFQDFQVNSTGEVGTRGRDMLRPLPYFSLVFEVDYLTGMNPDQIAIERFVVFVQEHTRKTVVVIQTEILGSGPQSLCPTPLCSPLPYTSERIVELHNKHRNVIPLPGAMTVYILYLDQSFEDNLVVGTSFCATCIAISKATIQGVSGGATLESVILAHEMMHLFGALCILYPISSDQYCDGTGHSTDPTSLLYPAPNWRSNHDVQNLVLKQNELDALEGLRNGRL